MKPGTKVEIIIDTWFAPSGSPGMVSEKQLSTNKGLISVHYLEEYEKDQFQLGPIFDFAPEYLKEIKDHE